MIIRQHMIKFNRVLKKNLLLVSYHGNRKASFLIPYFFIGLQS